MTSLSTFERFPNLPKELQDKIWASSCRIESHGRILRIQWGLTFTRGNRNFQEWEQDFSVTPPPSQPVPYILQACSESRTVAQKHYSLLPRFKAYKIGQPVAFFYANMEVDTFYFTLLTQQDGFMSPISRGPSAIQLFGAYAPHTSSTMNLPSWTVNIKSLAVNYGLIEQSIVLRTESEGIADEALNINNGSPSKSPQITSEESQEFHNWLNLSVGVFWDFSLELFSRFPHLDTLECVLPERQGEEGGKYMFGFWHQDGERGFVKWKGQQKRMMFKSEPIEKSWDLLMKKIDEELTSRKQGRLMVGDTNQEGKIVVNLSRCFRLVVKHY